MIWNFVVISAIVLIFLVLARRVPSAIEEVKKEEQAPLPKEKIKTYSLMAQADDAFEAKNFQKAEDLYIRAATNEPANAKIYDRLGQIYLEQKNYYDAKEAFTQTAKLENDVAVHFADLGLAYMGLKDYYKSCQSFQKALELDPKNKNYQKLFERAGRLREREQSRLKK